VSEKYFTIEPRRRYWGDEQARAARAAMRVYADGIRNRCPDEAKELDGWIKEEDNYDPSAGYVALGK